MKLLNKLKITFLFLLFILSPIMAMHQLVIVNGVPWYDENGAIVNAHGGSIIQSNGRYWLFGEYKSDTSNVFQGFSCYSSENLVNWRFERIVLPVQKNGILGHNRVGERVKVLHCPKTNEYVMLMHSDNLKYKDPHIGIATCKTIKGNYQMRGALMYKGKSIKYWDMGVFQDTDGHGYLLIHNGPIYRLNDDYLSVDTMIANVKGMGESPAMFKKDRTYFLLTSNLTSWERNDNYYFTAPFINGPWTRQGLFCPKGTLTWNSQTTYVLILSDGTPMYMGDRWSYPYQASAATYVWLPLLVKGNCLSIPRYWQSWDPTTIRPVSWLKNTEKKKIKFHTNRVGDKIEIAFKGTQVALIGEQTPHSAYAKIRLLDKNNHELYSTIVDFYAKIFSSGICFVSPKLPQSKYRLVVEVTGIRPNWTDKSAHIYGTDNTFVTLSNICIFQ